LASALDIIIRNVESKAYREFKARAAKAGMRLGEALKQAMESWSAPTDSEASPPHDQNDDAFRRMRSVLERKYAGKYIAIANGQLVAVADTLERLAAELRERRITRCRTVRLSVEETGEGGEWLWSSIGQEIASTTTVK
jgi:hypothetical protein